MNGYDAWKLASPEDDVPSAEDENDGPVMPRKVSPVDMADGDILF